MADYTVWYTNASEEPAEAALKGITKIKNDHSVVSFLDKDRRIVFAVNILRLNSYVDNSSLVR